MTQISYDRPNLDIEYDGVAIIDGLEEVERVKWGISDKLTSNLSGAGFQSALFKCGNVAGVKQALSGIRHWAEASIYYCVHVVAHGTSDKKGIAIGATDVLEWRDFGRSLVPINRAMGGQLIVNMTTCFGIHALKSVDLGDGDDPFFGVIAVRDELGVPDEALQLNDQIYQLWFNGMPINKIVHAINGKMGREFLYCGSAEGYRKLR